MDQRFTTLTPSNALAKLAFSEVVESAMRNNQTNTPKQMLGIEVGTKPEYHVDVFRLRLAAARVWHAERGESESPTEPDSENEPEDQDLDMV
jgi:hypothetical protein